MRRSNLGLLLRHLRDCGPQSRARLAAETGLSKATTSSLIGDLVDRGLVSEGEFEREGAVGRPGMALDLDGSSLCGVGVEINADYLSLTAVSLTGELIVQKSQPIDAAAIVADEVLDAVAVMLASALETLRVRSKRPVAIGVAVPGVIDPKSGLVRLAPNVGWRDVKVVDGLRQRLGDSAPSILLENDAKLGVMAEYAQVFRTGIHDLLYVTGDAGVGGGIIAGGHLVRGSEGFAGEIGHMSLGSGMLACACGRNGCWETVVGLPALLKLVADTGDATTDPSRDLESRLGELLMRADAGDQRTLDGLKAISSELAYGVSVLVDVLNPRRVILGGYFAYFGRYLIEGVRELLADRIMDAGPDGCEVTVSRLGLTAAARGGAHLALETVFQDPTLVERAQLD